MNGRLGGKLRSGFLHNYPLLKDIGIMIAIGSRLIDITNKAGWTQSAGWFGTWHLHSWLPWIEMGLLTIGLALFILMSQLEKYATRQPRNP